MRLSLIAVALCMVCLSACGDSGGFGGGEVPAPRVSASTRAQVAEGFAGCAECHPSQVEAYLGHGMAHTLGDLDEANRPSGEWVDEQSGMRYAFVETADGLDMVATAADGGQRTQRIVGRYGAGVIDMSFIGAELDRERQPTGRLSFLPVEFARGHGLVPSPFEVSHPGTGFEMPFAVECLGCHTNQDPALLPGAAKDAESHHVWPSSQLGADAFDHLQPLGCDTCHGTVEKHQALKLASLESGKPSPELGFPRIGDLSAGAQRDICARCHLEGDGHLELEEYSHRGQQPADFLLRRPVLVPKQPGPDHRFVGQLERLAHSACFKQAPEMTCTTCHDPHASVAAQGTASFDAACIQCHEAAPQALCNRKTSLTVESVTGEAARTETGCVDCHVRRSQPFDIPKLRSADHFVRRRIARPAQMPMREVADPNAEYTIFDDGRFTELLSTPEGERWVRHIVSLRLPNFGRLKEGLAGMRDFPVGGAGAGADTGTDFRLPPLEHSAVVHHLRGLMLESANQPAAAVEAYGEALRIDPGHPQARLNRGSVLLGLGRVEEALADAAELVRRYPEAEKPWNLRALAAARVNDVPAMSAALVESTWVWPSDAASWHMLGQAFLAMDRKDDARLALDQAAKLSPSRPGLAKDRAAAGAR